MSAKRLTLTPPEDPVLRKIATPVTEPGSVKKLAAELLVTMEAEGGVGLAAPQVGHSVRMFVTAAGGGPQVFINPEITHRSREQILWEEGCLSLPRLLGNVKRPKRVTMKATALDGTAIELKADDLLARVIQHEIDHLDGILFPDRMPDPRKLKTISEAEWQSRFAGAEDLKNSEM